MEAEIDLFQIEQRIRGRVKKQMEKSQREYYLNEQMKAIQKELGRYRRSWSQSWTSLDKQKLPRPACPRPPARRAESELSQAQNDVADVR